MYIPDAVPEQDRETMVGKAKFGDEVKWGDTIGVLIVDMTNEFVDDRYANAFEETGRPAARAINRLMTAAREQGISGYYSRSLKGDHPYESGQWNTTSEQEVQTEEMTELTDELSPGEDDIVFDKYKPSIFFGTQLESMLNAGGVDTVIVTGMTTSGCVRATVTDAFSYNYNVIIPEECVADRSQISHQISLFDMGMKYADVLPLDEIIEKIRQL
jgi:nicotinamidase-related amidase